MAVKEGVLLKLKNNTAEIANLTDVSISFGKQVINVTTKSDSYWRALLHGTRSCTISANGFVDYSATEGWTQLRADFATNTDVSFEVSTDITGDPNETGSGILSSLEKTGSLDEGMTFSVTIEVNGAPTAGTES